MRKSRYVQLRNSMVVHQVKNNSPKVIIKMVSCMCDNESEIIFVRGEGGSYSMFSRLPSGMGNSISNYQIPFTKEDIIWEAEDNNWEEVLKMINKGTAVIESVKSRRSVKSSTNLEETNKETSRLIDEFEKLGIDYRGDYDYIKKQTGITDQLTIVVEHEGQNIYLGFDRWGFCLETDIEGIENQDQISLQKAVKMVANIVS